jgi:hypothetical protein
MKILLIETAMFIYDLDQKQQPQMCRWYSSIIEITNRVKPKQSEHPVIPTDLHYKSPQE